MDAGESHHPSLNVVGVVVHKRKGFVQLWYQSIRKQNNGWQRIIRRPLPPNILKNFVVRNGAVTSIVHVGQTRVGADTVSCVALSGDPIAFSLSPPIHTSAMNRNKSGCVVLVLLEQFRNRVLGLLPNALARNHVFESGQPIGEGVSVNE